MCSNFSYSSQSESQSLGSVTRARPSFREKVGTGFDVAVVGGGLSGTTAALQLARRGFNVTLVDMGKSALGGRMSTRRVKEGDLVFDHGCQLIRASDPQMQAITAEWVKAGQAVQYEGRLGAYDCATGEFTPREALRPQDLAQDCGFFGILRPGALYCGVPKMDSLPRYMSSAHSGIRNVLLNTRVYRARFSSLTNKWALSGETVVVGSDRGKKGAAADCAIGSFDVLVFADSSFGRPASPGVITFEGTVPPALTSLMRQLDTLERECLFTLMVAWDAATPMLPFDAACLRNSKYFSYVANNTSKPGRARKDRVQCWVAITRSEYARTLLDGVSPQDVLPHQTPDYIAEKAAEMWSSLQRDMQAVIGIRPLGKPAHVSAHRWGAARVVNPLRTASVSDLEGRFVACGDFCLGAGAENTVLSALSAVDAVTQIVSPHNQLLQQQRSMTSSPQ